MADEKSVNAMQGYNPGPLAEAALQRGLNPAPLSQAVQQLTQGSNPASSQPSPSNTPPVSSGPQSNPK